MPAREAHGPVPKKHAERLAKAVLAWRTSLIERDAAIVAALKAGASTHQVAQVTGMAQSVIHRIGHKGGWPTAEQRRGWAEHQKQVDEWRQWLDAALDRLDQEPSTED